MPFPCDPCEHCPRVARGLPMPCRAMITAHARFCELAARDDVSYIALLCGDVPVPTKARVPLGVKASSGRR